MNGNYMESALERYNREAKETIERAGWKLDWAESLAISILDETQTMQKGSAVRYLSSVLRRLKSENPTSPGTT